MNPILIGLFSYLIVVLAIGLKNAGKNKTHADYLLADRKLGAWAIALSERASGESAWLLIGLPGAALAVGFLEIWTVFGSLAGIIISWLFIAVPLRELAGKYNSLTLPDLIANFFNDETKLLRIISALIITFFFTFYIAAQFNAAGKVLNVTFGIPQLSGMIIGAGIILLYTILGGFRAVVWTDVVQSVIMLSALVILPIVGVIELAQADHNYFAELSPAMFSLSGGKTGIAALLAVLGGLSWGFGYTGQPHLLARFIAIKDSSEIKRGRVIAFTWAIPAFFGAFFMGVVGVALYGADKFADPEFLMPFMATSLLPGWFAGILISGAMAAMMSTADSQLLVTASAISEDLIHKVGKQDLSPEKLLNIGRLSTIFVGIIAFIMAYTSTDLVFSLVSYAWSGLGASFGPVLLGIIYWKKITKEGALAGMLTGATSTILWKNIATLNNIISERFASYLLAVAAIILISVLTHRKTRNSKGKPG
ncbi:MAG: sodium/proline symporter [Candidatus Marinimicrobia bacterium]|nr:sodium/proline symporter [Candidatus Neomarinimicrobiota bacterium]